MNTSLQHKLPADLPATQSDLSPLRQLKAKRPLNDIVEDIIVGLWDNDEFQEFLYAVWDEQAVTGSLSFDNCKVAEMILERARKTGVEEVAKQKLATIWKSANVVLRRYNQSRKTRRNTVKGEVVPAEKNGDTE